jgi:predicted DNA binding CopG/RHH family protein
MMATKTKRVVKPISKGKKTLPVFRSDDDERAYWSKHSVEELSDVLDDLDVEVQPARTEQIAVRLFKEDLDTLRRVASKKGIGHTTLARTVLEQWIDKVRDPMYDDARLRVRKRRRARRPA